MRLRETIKIDDKEITVKELTVRDIRDTWEKMSLLFDIKNVAMFELESVNPFFKKCIEGVEIADLYDMAPSDIEKIMEAFQRVNAVFFKLSRNVEGENPLLIQTRKLLVATLIGKFVDSSKEVTVESGITDGASTSPPAK